MADVIRFPGNSFIPEKPETVLGQAMAWDLDQVVIVGLDKSGQFRFGGSHCEVPMIGFLLDLAKKRLMETADP